MNANKVIYVSDNRRLVSYEYGWKIERLAPATDKKPKATWVNDLAPYPPSLKRGLFNIVERMFAEEPDVQMGDIPEQLERVLKAFDDLEIVLEEKAKELEDGE